MAVGIPVMVPPHSSPSVTTTGAAEPTRAGSDSSTHEPTAATRVATILCTVIPVLVVLGMLVAGAFWIRHRSSARKRRGRVGSTITIEGDDGDEEEGGSRRRTDRDSFPPPAVFARSPSDADSPGSRPRNLAARLCELLALLLFRPVPPASARCRLRPQPPPQHALAGSQSALKATEAWPAGAHLPLWPSSSAAAVATAAAVASSPTVASGSIPAGSRQEEEDHELLQRIPKLPPPVYRP